MLDWIKRERLPPSGLDDEDEPIETWDLHRPDVSWKVWKLLEALEWKYPPVVMLQQPEWLMDDLAIISWRKGVLREMMKGSVDATAGRKLYS